MVKSNSILSFLLLVLVVVFLQQILLAPHLRYGFADVDWGYLLEYKKLGQYPLLHIIEAWKKIGVYTYQAYYIGILEHLFPIDGFQFINIHIATHFFKFLSAITLFPVVLVLTGKKLLAALTTVFYAIAYPAVGPIYTVVVSGHYVAITVMNFFLLYYFIIIKKNKTGPLWLLGWLLLLILTLFLSPERMYPLIPIILITEIFWIWIKRHSKSTLINSSKRLVILFGPLITILLFRIFSGTSYFGDVLGFSANTQVIAQKISQGNWQLILNPLISLGSLFFPREYWGLVGSDKIVLTSFSEFFNFFFGLFIFFFIFLAVLSFFVSKKRLKFILLTSVISIVGSIIVFLIARHELFIEASLRLHFDTMFIKPAIIAIFILALSLSLFNEWVLNGKKDIYLLGLSLGPIFAFLFIFLTWIPSDYTLTFAGVHRYLVIPAIGSSLAISALIVLIYEKIRAIKWMKNFAWVIFLGVIPIIQMDFYVVSNYFNFELNVEGMDGAEHARMKNKLLSSLGNFTFQEPSLFYFDEWPPDPLNGYFQETTIIAGFQGWTMFMGKSKPVDGVRPVYIRNADICPQVIDNCFTKLKDFVTVRNGEEGILYKDVFYKKENFFAFRFKKRDIFDIRPEVTRKINLN